MGKLWRCRDELW